LFRLFFCFLFLSLLVAFGALYVALGSFFVVLYLLCFVLQDLIVLCMSLPDCVHPRHHGLCIGWWITMVLRQQLWNHFWKVTCILSLYGKKANAQKGKPTLDGQLSKFSGFQDCYPDIKDETYTHISRIYGTQNWSLLSFTRRLKL